MMRCRRLIRTLVAMLPRRFLRLAVSIVILGVSVAVMVHLLAENYERVSRDIRDLRWEVITVAFLAVLAANLSGGFFWKLVLTASGAQISLLTSIRIWCVSGALKYALGALTQLAGRIYLTERAGVPRYIVIISLGIETILILMSGAGLILLSLPFSAGVIAIDLPFLSPIVSILLGIVVPGATPILISRGVSAGRRLSFLNPSPMASQTSLWTALVVILFNWSLLGIASFLILASIREADIRMLPFFIAAVTAAVILGLAGFTPLGLGVRDVSLTLLLSHAIPLADASIIAILHRLLTILADLFAALGVLIVGLVRARFQAGGVGVTGRDRADNPRSSPRSAGR
ncbi:MAG TPA: lysylphosphatidylglycerol synthase domain-containing protein [Chloroflexota bacterium]|nr:lysylphosphatidylglycerol synthase domain-containing protein [Chloroflexota bacterium]